MDNHVCECIVDAAKVPKQKPKRQAKQKKTQKKTAKNVNSPDKQHSGSSSDDNLDNDTDTAIESINRSERQPGDSSGLDMASKSNTGKSTASNTRNLSVIPQTQQYKQSRDIDQAHPSASTQCPPWAAQLINNVRDTNNKLSKLDTIEKTLIKLFKVTDSYFYQTNTALYPVKSENSPTTADDR